MSRDREWDRNSRCMRVGREQDATASVLTITNPDNFLFFSLTHHACSYGSMISMLLVFSMLLSMGAIT